MTLAKEEQPDLEGVCRLQPFLFSTFKLLKFYNFMILCRFLVLQMYSLLLLHVNYIWLYSIRLYLCVN